MSEVQRPPFLLLLHRVISSYHHRYFASCAHLRRDRLRVERVDVLAGRQHQRVPDRVPPRARLDVLPAQRLAERAELVVLYDLRQAVLDVPERARA